MKRKKIENRVGHSKDIQDDVFIRLHCKKEKTAYCNGFEKRVHKTSEFEFTAERTKPIRGKNPAKQQKPFSRYEKTTIFFMILDIVVTIFIFLVGLMIK